MKITVVVDAFRAFATASYALEKQPASYYLTNRCAVVSNLASSLNSPLLIGKPEKNSDLTYTIPNSPTRVKEVIVKDKEIVHRTEAGAMGILMSHTSDIILGAGFVNADATAYYIKKIKMAEITIIPMGHEGRTPSLEDELCAQYIQSLINGETMTLSSFFPQLKKGPGHYFFGNDQWQYPEADFERCLNIKRFNFVIGAEVQEGYACLKWIPVGLSQASLPKDS